MLWFLFLCLFPVHPHVGGETLKIRSLTSTRMPVHPHVGGETDDAELQGLIDIRSIPTWVGKPLSLEEHLTPPSGPSPRGWGNPFAHHCHGVKPTVHPHVGGETEQEHNLVWPIGRSIPTWVGKPVNCHPPLAMGCGPSPRGWGNRSLVDHVPTISSVHPHVGGETS